MTYEYTTNAYGNNCWLTTSSTTSSTSVATMCKYTTNWLEAYDLFRYDEIIKKEPKISRYDKTIKKEARISEDEIIGLLKE